MSIQHIFFDLDHTLWDFERNSELAFQRIFEERKIPVSITDFLKIYKPINFKYWKLYREEKVSKEVLRYNRLKETFEELTYSISTELIIAISEDYINFLSDYNHLFEGTIEILDYLKEKYELHIITNGFKEVQHLKMEKSGIKKYFTHIITAESIGVKKPDPKIFAYAMKLAKATPKNSVMIGDSYEADVIGGLDMGMSAIYCNLEKKENIKGISTIQSLIELKQYL
ncbi:YjjG family noncanonical pyrimidine nucleotidase [Tenacibaculum maritimum]|uniref:Putative haloacid dehalogenase-like hydrolase protein n=2 Tax=Tenacibaculum maritimum TaxID=107401 RepID=A0A2H1EBY0_9FLAO|nr:YjjG family noncanonical pyrimidine nucleotidase [Tenacibaculum maritimum]MCD9563014.1 YjjG family noncanonical pyrimidine nucleotidase [Tenacibaculum maritimum]MCD9566128.1 YjjG family noncanonical pyrimidine nucleotidase [Tenacibaculum maritimum]MCD9579516.1 YjjG family noncanonical pyrimidine nucleotidase [Tenacibaculum maritimum]MCD9585376.1 YjjG family noncanonical pyrimidine nucleotidase [Tenacibaculum maritimum]MCD9596635.1 YjjG family noncanonical pyrimidine nucleotidase [Tenacibacu